MERTHSFGYWLRRRRKALDLTQTELAERVGCSVDTIRKLEADARRPSRQMAELLARHLGLPEQERAAFLQSARGERPVDQLAVPDQPEAAPAPQQPGAARAALPAPATPLVGRTRELARISELLLGEPVRLLTLTGPPGIGKTRLALQAASELQAAFPGAVCFIPLAPLSDPQLLLPSIAQLLGLSESSGPALLSALQHFVRGKRLLLVLDNFEQLLPAAPLLSELLAQASGLQLLVTSRAVLHLYGEHELPVPPLGLPDLGQLESATVTETLSALSQSEAVRLFVARAQAVRPSFAVDNTNARAIAELCVRLDGLPLAIELAAARSKLFTPQALLARLEQRLSLLSGGPRDLPARQQTLRAAIDWSYGLLSPPEQQLFRRLGVFVGGWRLEAVEAICGQDPAGADMFETLASLLDKSLIEQRSDPDGTLRFTMLETIRAYALEQLEHSAEATALRERHLRFFTELAEQAERELFSASRMAWLERLQRDYDNLRAALSCAAQLPDPELWLRLVGALLFLWDHLYAVEGLRWAQAAVAAGSQRGSGVCLARALLCLGMLEWLQGDPRSGRARLQEALAIFQQHGDRWRCAVTWQSLGLVAAAEGDLAQARACYTSALALARELGHRWGTANVLFTLGDVLLADDPGAARAAYEESLRLFREEGERYGASFALTGLGRLELHQGNYEQAYRHTAEALEIRRSSKSWYLAISLNSLGDVARARGDAQQAEALYQEALALAREIDHKASIAWSLYNLGAVALARGDAAAAAARFAESLALEQELGARQGIVRCLAGLVGVAATQGRAAAAAGLAGALESLLDAMGSGLEPLERQAYQSYRAMAERQLEPTAFAAAWAEGRRWSLDQALTCALEGLEQAG